MLSALQHADIDSLESSFAEIIEGFSSKHKQYCIDGKSLNGRKNDEGNVYHLVSVFCAELGGVVRQEFSKPGGGEITAALSLLEKIDINGKIITADALYAQSSLCEKITGNGGDYIFTVKDNQSELRHELLQIFRTIKQAAIITRYREDLNSGQSSTERVFIITSLCAKHAGPKELLQYNRNYWAIENGLHRQSDTLFDEDKQTIRCFDSPQANAAISNISLFLIKKAKYKSQKLKNLSFTAITQHFARNIPIPFNLLQNIAA